MAESIVDCRRQFSVFDDDGAAEKWDVGNELLEDEEHGGDERGAAIGDVAEVDGREIGAANEIGLIERYFFPLVAPWRSEWPVLQDGATTLECVSLQVQSVGDIAGAGILSIDLARGELKWGGFFSVVEDEDENNAVGASNDTDSNNQVRWNGCFLLSQILEVQHEGLGFGVVVTFENDAHQRVVLRLSCASEADEEQLVTAVTNNNRNLQVKEKKLNKKKREKRRVSISLDMVSEMLGSDDNDIPNQHEQQKYKQSIITERTIPLPVNVENIEQEPDADAALRDMVRAFVRSPTRVGHATREMCLSKYSYDLALVTSVSEERLARSPPRLKDPTPEQISRLGLRGIVKEMTRTTKLEKSQLEHATRSTIFAPKGSQKYFRYMDNDTEQEIDPKEYARRYLQTMAYETVSAPAPKPVTSFSKAKWDEVEPVSITAASISAAAAPMSATTAAAPSLDEQNSTVAKPKTATTPVVKTPSVVVFVEEETENFDFELELLNAERQLHEAFDHAIETFLDTRAALEQRRDQQQQQQQQERQKHVSKLKLDSTYNIRENEVTRKSSKKKSSQRRQSMLVDGLTDFLNSNDNENPKTKQKEVKQQPNQQSTRVLWSAKALV